jgi:hypothetical protein
MDFKLELVLTPVAPQSHFWDSALGSSVRPLS